MKNMSIHALTVADHEPQLAVKGSLPIQCASSPSGFRNAVCTHTSSRKCCKIYLFCRRGLLSKGTLYPFICF